VPEAQLHIIFGTAFLVAFSGAMMPGPLLTYAISASATHGFRTGPLLILGHGILELCLILLLVLGLDQVIEKDSFSTAIGLIGGTILILMGLHLTRQGYLKRSIPLAPSSAQLVQRKMVVAGIVVSISNPYWFIWWATIGMAYLIWALDLGAVGVAAFFSGHILADLGWYALVTFIVASGRKALNNTLYSWLLVVCGIALMVVGIYFLIYGIDALIN
jgi:threonine/homoserine/homoserine lactone efflux protein